MLTRALKEVRSLLPVAGLIVGAAALGTIAGYTRGTQHSGVTLLMLSFLVGMPLLAGTSFGSEFQQRTLVLLLSQPMARTRVWFEKWAVLVATACALAAIQLALVRLGPLAIGQREMGQPLLYLIAILCSAPFWTLVARSTIGGFAFSGGALALLELSARLVTEYAWPGTSGSFEPPFASMRALVALLLAYSAVTLWLGWRLFSRFQVTDAAYGGESFSFGGSSWSALHARPSGMLRNLVLKELWLHRPTFLIAIVFAVCWLIAVALLSVGPWQRGTQEFVLTVILLVYIPVATVLAGAVSIGEEATLAIRPWHLTLPVSARLQWAVKIAVSLLLTAGLAMALPYGSSALARGALSLGPPPPLESASRPLLWLLVTSVAILSFWAATLVGHTIRAAVAAGLFILGVMFGVTIADRLGEFAGASGADLLTSAIVRFQLPPDYPDFRQRTFETIAVSLIAIGLALVLRQSLLAFKRARTDNRTIVWYVAQLLAAVFVVVFCSTAFMAASSRQYRSAPVRELREATKIVLAAKPDECAVSRPVQLSDLEVTGRLSSATKEWLSRSYILATCAGISSGIRAYRVGTSFPHGKGFFFGITVDPKSPQ